MSSSVLPQPPSKLRPFSWRWWLRLVERMLAVFGGCFLVFYFTLLPTTIVSPSMAPTLQGHNWTDGDRVMSELVSYRFRRPRRWEVMAFRRADGAIIMKRVVGLPGERLQLNKKGDVIIDGAVAPKPDSLKELRYLPVDLVMDDKSVECGDGYFVLGDDSMDSEDSRFEGPISPSAVIGRAWFIFSPSSRVGWVNPH